MKNLLPVFAGLIFFYVGYLFAEPFSPIENSNTLSLNDYLALVRKNDPEYKKLTVDEQKARYLVNEGLPNQALIFNFEAEQGYGNDDIDTRSASASLSKEILKTGSLLTASHATLENTDRNEELTEFTVEQPLLKNAFGKDTALRESMLTKQEQISRLNALENYELFINEKAKLYLDFSQAAMEEKLAESLLNEAKKLYRHVDEKYKKSAANQTDLRRARLQVILREEDFLRKKENLGVVRMSILLSSNHPDVQVYPETEFNLQARHESAAREIPEVFNPDNFRQYQISLLSKDAIYEEYQLAKNISKAELNLLGGYKIDQSTRFTSSVNREEALVGVKLTVPFKDHQADAKASLAGLDLTIGELDQYKVERELNDAFQNLKAKLKQLEKEYLLSQEKVDIMQVVLQEEMKRYSLGRIDTVKIIEANNEFAQYQFEHKQKLLELNKSWIDWLSLNDKLVVTSSAFFNEEAIATHD